ncbi:peptide chain release factor 1 [Acetobacteraceae bacterium]|nr:peptide chain release factor 1 [Acetobacteraceae bacterium]
MKMDEKLEKILARFAEVQHLLLSAQGDEYAELACEYAILEEPVAAINAWQKLLKRKAEAIELLEDDDFKELAQNDLDEVQLKLPDLEKAVKLALLPKDEMDERSAILEIRPAAGGDEAALFAGDMFELYRRFSEKKGWKFDVVSISQTELSGFREGVAEITGKSVFSFLKYESGVHRVQRVPSTESQGRIHTSTITVAVLPKAEEVDVNIKDEDLRIDVFRASGAGGQHVNKTESAVRITHLPTGIVVAIQEEKSQHRNRLRAMQILRARLYERQRQELHDARAADRKSQLGTGDRSERIRTYNFPQGRVTDHRINLTLYKLSQVMAGELDEIVDGLAQQAQIEALGSWD